ncbi:unnamed protein product [Pseudomonas viridiflava]|uniref:Uncharacterized protein n=1 Tax=Pseudomonas viridiflava TaxID=33069 RepID=A0A1Y6JCW9_PSEVI|nr:unnamed protein product [Pseudomonas viridiflava]VVN85963.1 hypothetical protein PS689_01498 [Pseudomonas fluorescens]
MPHQVFDVALSRSKLGGSGPGGVPLVRECSISATAYASDVLAFRGQVRSHKIQFLQWLTGCLIRADLSANAVFQPLHMRRMYRPLRGQAERRPVRSYVS